MFYDNVLEEFAEKMQDDIYILPSSLHEVILVPRKGLEPGNLRSIVEDVNKTVVTKEEVLGENVYLYERKLKEIRVEMPNI